MTDRPKRPAKSPRQRQPKAKGHGLKAVVGKPLDTAGLADVLRALTARFEELEAVVRVTMEGAMSRAEVLEYVDALRKCFDKPTAVGGFDDLLRRVDVITASEAATRAMIANLNTLLRNGVAAAEQAEKTTAVAVARMADELAGVTQVVEKFGEAYDRNTAMLQELAAQVRAQTQALMGVGLIRGAPIVGDPATRTLPTALGPVQEPWNFIGDGRLPRPRCKARDYYLGNAANMWYACARDESHSGQHDDGRGHLWETTA
jgi:hypothetical protein